MEEFVEKIIKKYDHRKDHLIPILQDVQKEHGYLSEVVIESISDALKVPVNRIYGVATFYDQFRFKPLKETGKRKVEIVINPVEVTEADKSFLIEKVLKNTTDMYRKEDAERLARMQREKVVKPVIYISTGSCSEDSGADETFRVILGFIKKNKWDAEVVEVGCNGNCSESPVMDVHVPGKCRISFKKVTPDKVEEILQSVIAKTINPDTVLGQYKVSRQESWPNVPNIDQMSWFSNQQRIVLGNTGHISPYSIADYICKGGYKSLYKTVLNYVPEKVCDLIEESGLQGRGGGGFSAGRKWKVTLNTAGDEKYLVCNADESDPGAFIDRAIIESNPHLLLEGIAIAAYAIGANHAYIFIRSGYPRTLAVLDQAVKQAKEFGILGQNIFTSGFNLSISIRQGAGAFVCGEETAMIASIEGKRGMPQTKPPYPAEIGLYGKPTIVNNVETLVNVPTIIEHNPLWFQGIGTESSKGTKIFSLNGCVNRHGFIEVPMGTKLSDIVYKIGGGIRDGRKLKAVQFGGPMGIFLPESSLDLEIGYQSIHEKGAMLGSGGITVLDDTCCMVNQSLRFTEFMQYESCGKCIPCREGSRRILEIIENITRRPREESSNETLERFKGIVQLESLSTIIRETSLCGLGRNAPNLVISAITHFRDDFEEHIFDRKCAAGICRELRAFYINVDTCNGCNVCQKKCPEDAIIGVIKYPHFIVEEKCNGCGICFDECKFNAISIL